MSSASTSMPYNWIADIQGLPNTGVGLMDFILSLPNGSSKYGKNAVITRVAHACANCGLLKAEDVAKPATELISSKVVSTTLRAVKSKDLETFLYFKHAMIGDDMKKDGPTKKRKRESGSGAAGVGGYPTVRGATPVLVELTPSEKKKVARKVEKMNKKLTERSSNVSEIPKTLPAGVTKTSFKGKVLLLPNDGKKLLEFIETLPVGVSKFERGHTYKRFLKAAIMQNVVPDDMLKQTKSGQLGIKGRKAIEAAVSAMSVGPEGDVVFDRLKEAIIGEVTLGGTVKKLAKTMAEHRARVMALEVRETALAAGYMLQPKRRGRKPKNAAGAEEGGTGTEPDGAGEQQGTERVATENVKTIQSERLRAAITDKESFSKLPQVMQQQLLERYMASLL